MLFKKKPPPVWMAQAAWMWREGMSSTEIADHFKVDRLTILRFSQRNRQHFPHRDQDFMKQQAVKNAATRSGPKRTGLRTPRRSQKYD